jgi:hypothetical protein
VSFEKSTAKNTCTHRAMSDSNSDDVSLPGAGGSDGAGSDGAVTSSDGAGSASDGGAGAAAGAAAGGAGRSPDTPAYAITEGVHTLHVFATNHAVFTFSRVFLAALKMFQMRNALPRDAFPLYDVDRLVEAVRGTDAVAAAAAAACAAAAGAGAAVAPAAERLIAKTANDFCELLLNPKRYNPIRNAIAHAYTRSGKRCPPLVPLFSRLIRKTHGEKVTFTLLAFFSHGLKRPPRRHYATVACALARILSDLDPAGKVRFPVDEVVFVSRLDVIPHDVEQTFKAAIAPFEGSRYSKFLESDLLAPGVLFSDAPRIIFPTPEQRHEFAVRSVASIPEVSHDDAQMRYLGIPRGTLVLMERRPAAPTVPSETVFVRVI